MITAYSISRICGSGVMGRGVGGIGRQGWRKKENGGKFEKEGMEKKVGERKERKAWMERNIGRQIYRGGRVYIETQYMTIA